MPYLIDSLLVRFYLYSYLQDPHELSFQFKIQLSKSSLENSERLSQSHAKKIHYVTQHTFNVALD